MSTSANLSTIRNRNERRQSLSLDNEYSDESEKSENEEVQLDPLFPPLSPMTTTNRELSMEEIEQVIADINRTFPRRVNKRKTEVSDPDYVSRFRENGPVGQPDTSYPLHTIFDSPHFKQSSGFGIYVLFWLGTGFLMLTQIVNYVFKNKEVVPFLEWPIVQIFRKDLLKVGLTDLAMYLSSYVPFLIQYAIVLKVFEWRRTGLVLQSLYTAVYFFFWMWFAGKGCMGFPWIARVFLVLHSLVFVMKMHSYAFYNGYLWRIYREQKYSSWLLSEIERREREEKKENGLKALNKLSSPLKEVTIKEKLTRTSSFSLSDKEVRSTLEKSVEYCRFEFEYQSNVNYTCGKKNVFPSNISLFNYFEYSMMPTVVYTLNFPRTQRIRPMFVFEKVAGTFGIIFLMISIAQNWLYPAVMSGFAARELPLRERAVEYLFILLDMIPPFLMIYLLNFLLIWDMILNAIAELSYYADRDFYGPWWSSVDWYEFSRIWNVPVHKFLLRHVYHSSISAFNLNKAQAGLVTFMLSSVVHELVMYVIFGKVRGYLLLLQMSQLPLIALSRSRYLRDKRVLGNVVCWFGFASGPSSMLALYVVW